MDKGAWPDGANLAEECGSVRALARVAAARLCYSHTNCLITAPATPCTTQPLYMSCHRARREHVPVEVEEYCVLFVVQHRYIRLWAVRYVGSQQKRTSCQVSGVPGESSVPLSRSLKSRRGPHAARRSCDTPMGSVHQAIWRRGAQGERATALTVLRVTNSLT